MRPLEAIVMLVNALVLISFGVGSLRARRVRWSVAVAAFGAATAQVWFEGWRWQMTPAYVLALAAVACRPVRRAPALVVAGHMAVLIVSIGLPLAVPVSTLPRPPGPYAVGTQTYHWVDVARDERFTQDPADKRQLIVQLWYPAQATATAPRAPYITDPAALVPLARLLHLPEFAFGHLVYIKTNALVNVRVAPANSRHPVLIFSHGRGGFRQQNTLLFEALASHGYIVASIDHSYAASGVVFPDGRMAMLDPRMLERAFVDSMVPYLAADVRFVLDQLEQLNHADSGSPFGGQIDLARVGALGLSMGGQVAAESCRLDARLRACLIMDVWLTPDVLRDGLTQPVMLMTRDAATMKQEGWRQADIDDTLGDMRALFERCKGPSYYVEIPGMFHQDFSDATLLSPLTRLAGITGPIDPGMAREVVVEHSLTFFDRHLRSMPAMP